ncbi:MAG: nuclear transport factor 2 family protein [Betaproteobacteria bacterium]|nr:nuclear transport factor 2 family protein [Betaproteobacteria bacterium]MDH3435776.1 nuclear transport factor 2 family protein [Betaproteobacteria bacterium]
MKKLIRFVVGIVVPAFIMAGGMANSAMAQEAWDMDDVKEANEAFYAALSARDISAMAKVWTHKTEIRHIGPHNKEINVGLDAAMKNWKGLFAAFPEFKITCEQTYIRINGSTAWVSGLENAHWKNKVGDTHTRTQFGTSIFEKHGDQWLMVYHHASAVPQ